MLIWHSSLAFYLAFHLGLLSGILIWHSYLAFISGILSGTLSDVLSGILSGISFGILSAGWGPAGNTWRGFSRLRSGREHWAWMVAVEVQQGTLGVDSRGWGPAGNTWRGFSRLRWGREHLAWILAVEVGQGTLGVDGRGWGPEEAEGGGRRRKGAEGGGRRKSTDIKSNNPHLAGGEQTSLFKHYSCFFLVNLCVPAITQMLIMVEHENHPISGHYVTYVFHLAGRKNKIRMSPTWNPTTKDETIQTNKNVCLVNIRSFWFWTWWIKDEVIGSGHAMPEWKFHI